MKRRRIAFLAPLLAALAILLGISPSASGAFNHAATEVHYGDFLLWEAKDLEVSAIEIADPTRGNGEWVYDPATGVLFYVRQNPWTKFDPLGLYEMNGAGHHIIPKAVIRDLGLGDEVKEMLDRQAYRIDTSKNGHGWSRQHNRYNKEVAAEAAELIKDQKIKNVGSMSAKEQRKFAVQLVQRVQMDNSYTKGFNNHVAEGLNGLRKWWNDGAKNTVLKSTCKKAHMTGQKVVTGVGKPSKLKKLASKAPGLGTVVLVGGAVVGVAGGQEIGDAGIDLVMGATGGDIAQSAIGSVTDGLEAVYNKRNEQIVDNEAHFATSLEEQKEIYEKEFRSK